MKTKQVPFGTSAEGEFYAGGNLAPAEEVLAQSRWQRNAARIVRVLREADVYTREDLLQRYDSRSNYRDIKGIGPVLGLQLRKMVDELGYDRWKAATGMPWEG